MEKSFCYFNGNHDDFNRQIKSGIAEVLVNKILFGTDWKQTVKNSSFINLPSWFKDGRIRLPFIEMGHKKRRRPQRFNSEW